MNEVTEQKFESSLQSLCGVQLCDACLGVMSRGFQGSRSQTRTAWAIEAGEGGDGQEHEGVLGSIRQRGAGRRKDCGL